MCSRMAIGFDSSEAKKEFDIDIVKKAFKPKYNVAPSYYIPVIISGSRILDLYKWGFIPHWAKDNPNKYKMINTRAETIAEKRSFAEALEKFRCVVLASGFYEWTEEKKPFYFKVKGAKIFPFAAIASFWTNPEGEKIATCSIITTEANKAVRKVHNRMPVILDKSQIDEWIDKENKDTEKLLKMLKPYDASKLEYFEVNKDVNNVRNESPDFIKPLKK